MNISPILLSLTAAILLSGCNSPKVDPPAPVTGNCPVQMPKDINFWINAMPGPNTGQGKPLLGTFTVTAPTPGYTFTAKVDRIMESQPIQAIINLTATPPSGTVIQVLTETEVNIRIPNFPGKEDSRVSVHCGGKPFFTVKKIAVTH